MTYRGIRLRHQESAYATHQPVLVWALENSTGPVLELGAGEFSTPLLRRLAIETGRNVVTVESDENWLQRYSMSDVSNHQFRHAPQWMPVLDELSKRTWGVVFIDLSPELYRYYALCRMLPVAQYIVGHDADLMRHYRAYYFNWFEFIPEVQPKPERNGPSTMIISQTTDLRGIVIPQ